VIWADGNVAGTNVAEHVWDVVFRSDLEKIAHLGSAPGTGWILGTLNPRRPAEKFVTFFGLIAFDDVTDQIVRNIDVESD